MINTIHNKIELFFQSQIKEWDLLKQNYNSLKNLNTRNIHIDSEEITLQHNPCRVKSTNAKIDDSSIKARACFLCEKNLPFQQAKYPINKEFYLLCNPYPIFKNHYTLPLIKHNKQEINSYLIQFFDITKKLENFVIFYNGPKCGASAPDHMHFQAIPQNTVSLFDFCNKEMLKNNSNHILYTSKTIKCFNSALSNFIYIESNDLTKAINSFKLIYNILPIHENEYEPRLNILARYYNNNWQIIIIPRKKHRPKEFFYEDTKQIKISPASIDFAGVIIIPNTSNFKSINANIIKEIYSQLTYNSSEFLEIINKINSKENDIHTTYY